MQDNHSEKRRNVVPRWKSITEMPEVELRSSLKRDHAPVFKSNWLSRAEQAWRHEKNDENAIDLLDAAIIASKNEMAFEAAAFIVGRSKNIADRVLLAATQVMANRPIDIFGHSLEAETNVASAEIIRRLKTRMRDHSRDPITAVELSRLYARQGQRDAALRMMSIAVSLAPNDRFVLRSATRLYTMMMQSERALEVLRRADGGNHDPWIQSAEIATSELANKGSKFAGSALRKLRNAAELPRHMSELALAVATLEDKSGAKKRNTFQLIRAGLSHATENALTQAVWLTDNIGANFTDRFPDFTLPAHAHEARTLETYEQGLFLESEKECSLWVNDQPFQSRGPLLLASINMVYLGRYESAAIVSERALQLHTTDWSIANSAVVARALNNQVELARANLNRLKHLCKTDVSNAFLSAAQGLIAFKDGDVVGGREFYNKAFHLSRKASRPDLVATAAMYYAEAEAAAGSASESEIIQFVKHLDEIILRRFKGGKDGIVRLWESRRKFVDGHLVERFNKNLIPKITSNGSLTEFPALQD